MGRKHKLISRVAPRDIKEGEMFDEFFNPVTDPALLTTRDAALALDALNKSRSDDLVPHTVDLLKQVPLGGLVPLCNYGFKAASSSHHKIMALLETVMARREELCKDYHTADIIFGRWSYDLGNRMVRYFVEESNVPPMRVALKEYAAFLKFSYMLKDIKMPGIVCIRPLVAIFKKLAPGAIELADFLPVASRRIPYHPYMVYFDEGRLLPRVWNHSVILVPRVCEALCDYIAVDEEQREFVHLPAVIAALDFISAPREFGEDMQTILEPVLFSLFPYIQDHELGQNRVDIMRRAEKIIKKFLPASRVLILKRLAEQLTRVNLDIKGAPMLLAWIIDLYKDNLTEEIFKEELGSFWVILEKVRYEDIDVALAYYIAVQNLLQKQILQKIGLKWVPVVRRRVIDGMRDQLGDWITLQKMKARADEEEPQNLGGVVLPRPIEDIDLLIYNFEYTNSLIADLPSQ